MERNSQLRKDTCLGYPDAAIGWKEVSIQVQVVFLDGVPIIGLIAVHLTVFPIKNLF